MYLTAKFNAEFREIDQHQEVEMLLGKYVNELRSTQWLSETYLNQVDEILSRITQIDEHMQTIEDIINISLDSQRNAMLLMELRLTMGTFAVANAAFIASIFGMNLTNGFETSATSFISVVAICIFVASTVLTVCSRQLSRIRCDPQRSFSSLISNHKPTRWWMDVLIAFARINDDSYRHESHE